MEWFWYIYIGTAGLALGSFYNVMGLRWTQGESVVHPRSACPSCGHTLRTGELIPVFSYLVQRGRCRSCGSRISPMYPGIELLTGLLFLAAAVSTGLTWELPVALLLISMLMVSIVTDLTETLILDRVLLLFGVPLLILRLTAASLEPWWDALLGAGAGFTLLLLIAILSKGGMGGGDIKLYAVLGAALGFVPMLLSLFLAALFGLAGTLLLHAKQRIQRKMEVPFGPYIAAGAVTAYFFGSDLLQWYTGLLTMGQ
ncbi:prepilin peptidase [Alkalicoccus chagannorensis]|uniref:prepilin peptidase n=1 Tax=Alkalicoccus chagannorensis TaxID=427072 RepID=UPI00041E1E42|nr:A24 family peptidase [Alkalicoccus chagannorensis]